LITRNGSSLFAVISLLMACDLDRIETIATIDRRSDSDVPRATGLASARVH
jgi:hypothetical protein